MTPDQINNWRDALSLTFGAYAFLMPVDQIERIRDRLQTEADMLARQEQRKKEVQKRRARKRRTGLCEHGVAAKHCKACE